jgi:hypothetical protein
MNLSKLHRSKAGLAGGVIGLVYMSFITVTDGVSTFNVLGGPGGNYPPTVKTNYVQSGATRP